MLTDAEVSTTSDPHGELLREASDPTTAPERLTRLGGAKGEAVLRALATNPSTPAALLASLVKQFPEDVIRNPVWPLLALARPDLSEKLDQSRAMMSSDQEVLERLARQPRHVEHVARNPSTAEALLASLARDGTSTVQALVASHPGCPVETLAWFAEFASDDLALAVAAHPRTPSDAIERLLQRPQEHEVYRSVASNPSTPVAILLVLAQRHAALHEELAMNPACPLDLLRELASHGQRARVATHPACTPALLEELASEDDGATLEQVARHPSTPTSLLGRLATHAQVRIRRAVAEHHACPPDALAALARDESAVVRKAVAAHPELPPAARQELLADRLKAVRIAAIEPPSRREFSTRE